MNTLKSLTLRLLAGTVVLVLVIGAGHLVSWLIG